MAEIEYDVESMDELYIALENAHVVYQDEKSAMAEVEYSGMGKVADAMKLLENKENDLLNCLDELYHKGVILMEYALRKIQETENAISEAMN